MKRAKLKLVLIGLTAIILAGCFLFLSGPNDPNHAGRPVSKWFRDLCSGVFGGTPKARGFDLAFAAFSEMEPHVAAEPESVAVFGGKSFMLSPEDFSHPADCLRSGHSLDSE